MNSLSSITASPLASTVKANYVSLISSQSTTSTSTTASSNEVSISTQWGFKVDENGYFGSDFNAAAGIPSNVHINEKTLESVAKSLQAIGSSQDPVSALSKAWSNFSKIAGSSLDSDGSMTLEQIHNMPVSYQTDSSIFGNIVSVQSTQEQFSQVEESFNAINTLSNGTLDTGVTTFFGVNKGVNKLSDYKDVLSEIGITSDEGNANENEISVGNLFSWFVEVDAPQENSNRVEATQAYYNDFLSSGQSIEDYAKSNFGEDFFKDAMNGYGTMSDSSYNGALVDQLLKELDTQVSQDREAYQKITHNNATKTQSINPTNTTAKSYLSLTDSTLSTGSLLSVGS